MPWLIETVFGAEFLGAVDAARIILVAAAIQFALGWSKSLPVTIGQPRLRIVTHGLEALVVIPLAAVLGRRVGRDGCGGRGARLDVRLRGGLGGRDRAPADRRRRAGGERRRRGRAVKVLVVSGIWPPDVGGPASHAPELADFLLARGHGVEVVTTADARARAGEYQMQWVPRRLPRGVRHARSSITIARHARSADVVYATSMLGRATLGSALARRPVVVKLVADEAYERARRLGLFDGDLDEFQRFEGGARVRALRRARDRALRRVDRLVCPSAYLASLAVRWGVREERVTVIPNAAPPLPAVPAREAARERFGLDAPTLAFAGRITRQKALEVALDALAQVEGVSLVVAGDGPDLGEVKPRRERAGPRRPRPLRRAARPRRRARALPRRRRVSALLVVGELPAHGRGGARGRDTGRRDGGRRCSGARPRRRERAARACGRRRGAGGRDPARHLRAGLRERLAEAAAPSVAHLETEKLYARLEDDPSRGRRAR